ncbi:MAG: type 1 glutamine amidotransferase [Alphaproteobacteria bacterium]
MNIGILICGHFVDEIKASYGTYRDLYADMLGEGYSCHPYFVVDGEFPASITEQDAWLVSGSRSGAYEDLPWISPLEHFLREAYAAQVPVVGICFGHQILAQALGGKVEKFAGGWSFGPVEYRFKEGPSQTIVAVHQDQVTALPEGARVIAETDFCAFAGLAYAGKALSFQPHPEFSTQFITDLTDIYADRLPADVLAQARETLDQPLDRDVMAQQIRTFLQDSTTPSTAGTPPA